jgi:hypothetical protein
MRNIYILWASIRPVFVLETSKKWVDNCVNKDNLYFQIIMANEEQKKEVEKFNIPNCEVSFTDEKPGYPYAITKLTRDLNINDEDIIILLSDDFICPSNWDEYIYHKFETWEDALFLNDGVWSVHNKTVGLITLACMTFSCLKKLNKVVFSPDYFHSYCDNEAFDNLYQLGLLKDDRDIDNVVFKHEHYCLGGRQKDEIDFRIDGYFKQDQETYLARKQMNVSERLSTFLV